MDIKKCVTLDVECYKNYFLCMFRRVADGKILYFEKYNDSTLDIASIKNILNKYLIVTFNGNKYDRLIVEAAVRGFSNVDMYKVSKSIIVEKLQPWQARKQFGLRELRYDHIDLIELCPLQASLKMYAGRLHCKHLQDLPLDPDAPMTDDLLEEMRTYCGYDNENTALILERVKPDIELREQMSKQYGVDLRSKSDAQIAETVTKHGIGRDIKKPKIPIGTEFKYVGPAYLDTFKTKQLQDIVKMYRELPITIGKSGHCELIFNREEAGTVNFVNGKAKVVKAKKQFKLTIGNTDYSVGIGGIHSKESNTSFKSCEKYQLRDYDVAAFYPNIILNNKLYPSHIGPKYLTLFANIVSTRLKAKAEKNKSVDRSLKVVINGSFGKYGSKYSILYAPDLMANVTITGQLTLLLLIERLELAGFSVISANTDGVVVKVPRDAASEARIADIIADWEIDTNYDMEASNYQSLNCRDVNAYVAIKDGDPANDAEYSDYNFNVKGKGLYGDQFDDYYCLRSNPSMYISTEAVKRYLKCDTPIEDTILSCTDIRKFVSLLTCNAGAMKNGGLLGKAVRWYYGKHELDAIHSAKNGDQLPKSEGAVPLMNLPDELPADIDYQRYIDESYTILKDIGRNVA